ncbi:MAG: PH domain-containing protein [Planctomycetota bacterium]
MIRRADDVATPQRTRLKRRVSTHWPKNRLPAEAGTGDAEAVDPAIARASAMLPRELLQPGEVIVLLLKPSPLFILLMPIRFIAAVVLIAMLARLLMNKGISLGLGSHDLVVTVVAVIGLRLFWELLHWLSHVYVLTDQRVIRVSGVLNVHVFEAPLKQVLQTDLVLPLVLRVFGLGTIAFATAGTATREAYWLLLAKPLEVHQKVVETLRRYGR